MLKNNTPAGKTALGLHYSSCHRYEEAAKLWTEASNQGDIEAMYNLALYYNSGKGVPQNFAKAISLLEKAASSKPTNPDGSRNVGKSLYLNAIDNQVFEKLKMYWETLI